MKKKISILLAVVMVLSLLPVNAVFAGTGLSNTKNKVTAYSSVVKKNTYFTNDPNLNMDNTATAPELVITADDNAYIDNGDSGVNKNNPFVRGDTFELRLTNADWYLTDGSGNEVDSIDLVGYFSGSSPTADKVATLKISNGIGIVTINTTAGLASIAETLAMEEELDEFGEVIVPAQQAREAVARYNELRIPLLSKTTASTGEISVKVTTFDANVTNGDYVFAKAGTATSSIYISNDPVEYKADSDFSVPTITIEEVSAGALDLGGTLTLTSSTDYEFISTGNITVSGGLGFETDLTGAYSVNPSTTDKSRITISLNGKNSILKSNGGRGRLQISGVRLSTPEDLSNGAESYITVSGADTTKTKILVGKFVDYGISFSLAEDEEVKTLFSGRFLENNIDTAAANYLLNRDDAHKAAKIQLKEDVLNSLWWDNKKVTFTVPSGVKIISAEVTLENTVPSGTHDVRANETVSFNNSSATLKADERVLTINRIQSAGGDPVNIEITLWLSIEATFTGDVTVTTNVLDGDEATIKVAEAIKPISVEVKSTNVSLGVRAPKIGDIVIKEAAPGAIMREGNKLTDANGDDTKETAAAKGGIYVNIETFGFNKGYVPTVEVTEGDLILDTDNIDVERVPNEDRYRLFIPIKRESEDTASTITISDVYLGDLSRVPASGGYYMSVGGDSIINNVNEKNTDALLKKVTFGTDAYKTNDYIVVGGTVGEETYGDFSKRVVFAIGETDYDVDGESLSDLDVAPFIENSRTYVPIRFVAQAFGIPEENVGWNGETREVIIDSGDKVIRLTIGSNVIFVNGVPRTMDVAAILRNQRTFVPIAHIASALGVRVGWDSETQEIIFNPTEEEIEERNLAMQ